MAVLEAEQLQSNSTQTQCPQWDQSPSLVITCSFHHPSALSSTSLSLLGVLLPLSSLLSLLHSVDLSHCLFPACSVFCFVFLQI